MVIWPSSAPAHASPNPAFGAGDVRFRTPVQEAPLTSDSPISESEIVGVEEEGCVPADVRNRTAGERYGLRGAARRPRIS